MNDIKMIEITISSINKNIEIVIDYNKLLVNNTKKIDLKLIEQLLNIICLWKDEYGYSNKIDAEEFIVKVFTDTKVDTFHGKGIYPSNYESFLDLVGELND